MKSHPHEGSETFVEAEVLHHLHHHLPAQAPLKDFIHHNSLHAFQEQPFHHGISAASAILGYQVSPDIKEYRAWYESGKIPTIYINDAIVRHKGTSHLAHWRELMLTKEFPKPEAPRIGKLRANWKRHYKMDLDALVHPIFFRTIGSYLDQGIATWTFPLSELPFLDAIRKLNETSIVKLIHGKRAQKLLLQHDLKIADLLHELVGEESLYHDYLFDMCFSHQGWSGMIATIESLPNSLLDQRGITLKDSILFELLLEIDALDNEFGPIWAPICQHLQGTHVPLFSKVPFNQYSEAIALWQEALEWSFHDPLVKAIKMSSLEQTTQKSETQAIFCIDDRECSLRRYLEIGSGRFETFGSPGFFGVAFYFKPMDGKFSTKLCPAPVTPKHLIKEVGESTIHRQEIHFSKHAQNPFIGALMSQLIGFWSAFKLVFGLFRPTMSAATASSSGHMNADSRLTIDHDLNNPFEDGLQLGYTIEEMCSSVEGFLKSIGLATHFGKLIYIVGHGSSSTNNPHFAAYDCGACSGRAGSVNARVMAYMANKPEVRVYLRFKGLNIPNSTRFIGALHDTTRDDIAFFDTDQLVDELQELHDENTRAFQVALDANAKERSRRFMSVHTNDAAKKVHGKVAERSVSLFEPRPELNHATNAACIVGRRTLSSHIFLDRRSFLNSFDYTIDPEGHFLHNILKAVAPVCGGINLEYYFSRVDNQKLGAGSKLPHNVMGLIGVANGIDGDLRPGLPSQMIEVHDPVRLMVVVEHFAEVVLSAVQKDEATYEWFLNEWVRLVSIDPKTHDTYLFVDGHFELFMPMRQVVHIAQDIETQIANNQENIPIQILKAV